MTAKENLEKRPAVGGPLPLAEARYLRHELAKRGVTAKLRRVPSSDPGERLVVVAPEDLTTAELARDELLGDPDEVDEAASTPGAEGRHGRKSAFVLGLLGFVTGLRVGTRALGSLWLGVVFAVMLSALALGASRLLFHSTRE